MHGKYIILQLDALGLQEHELFFLLQVDLVSLAEFISSQSHGGDVTPFRRYQLVQRRVEGVQTQPKAFRLLDQFGGLFGFSLLVLFFNA